MALVHLTEKADISPKKPAGAAHCQSPEDERTLSSTEINRRFAKAIAAIGYNETQQERIVRSFTIERKIKTIVALQRFEEKKRNISFYVRQLATRDSTMGLIFLRMSLETRSKEGEAEKSLYRHFLNEGGAALLERLFGSHDQAFLEHLMKFVCFLVDVHMFKGDILSRILPRYELLPKGMFFAYLNRAEHLGALFAEPAGYGLSLLDANGKMPHCVHQDSADCLCKTYLAVIVNDVLKASSIGDELDFLSRLGIKLSRVLDVSYLKKQAGKFAKASTYDELLGSFQSEVGVSGGLQAGGGGSFMPAQTVGTPIRAASSTGIELEALHSELLSLKEEKLKLGESVQVLEATIRRLTNENAAMQERLKEHSSGGSLGSIRTVGSAVAQTKASAAGNSSVSAAPEPVYAQASPDPTPAPQDRTPAPKAGFLPKLKKFGLKKQAQKKSKFAEKSYSGLRWNKIASASSSIFEDIDTSALEDSLDFSDFRSFETRRTAPARQTPPSTAAEDRVDASVLWDPKKSYALNIALGRVKLTNEELLNHILQRSLENENLVSQLILYFPGAEELSSLKKAGNLLGRAELFFRAVDNPDVLYSSLHHIRFVSLLRNRDYLRLLTEIENVCRRLLGSRELVKLFGMLLLIGNVLNTNTFNGNATAFSIDSLDAFKSKEILGIVSRKLDKKKLLEELGSSADFPIEIEVISQEINELKQAYSEEFLDENVKLQFNQMLDKHRHVFAVYKKMLNYFMTQDSRCVRMILDFIESIPSNR